VVKKLPEEINFVIILVLLSIEKNNILNVGKMEKRMD
jgi:hypothetical protein